MPGPQDDDATGAETIVTARPSHPPLPSRSLVRVVPARGPGLIPLVAAVVATGVAAGFLELAVFAFQVHVLHLVDLTSLRISRHVAWMIPTAEVAVTVPLGLLLIAPAFLLAKLRDRDGSRGGHARATVWAGAVLGTLLVLGPLLAIRGLYPVAALVLAMGVGVRSRKLLVRASPGWSKAARWLGGIAVAGFVPFVAWDYHRVANAGERAFALPSIQAPNVLWIVLDTTRADRLSLYGYDRPTTPNLERWAKDAITFDEARSAAPWTLPSHVSMFTSLWPYEQGARIDKPYRGSHPTIAEHLGDRGYTTAGFPANTGMCNACFGVGRGFDTYVELECNHEVSPRATLLNSALGTQALRTLKMVGVKVPTAFPFPGRAMAPTILARGRDWIEQVAPEGSEAGGHPYFLFLNFMDVHGPYYPPTDAGRVFSADRPLPPRKWCVPTTGSDAARALKSAKPEDRPRLESELAAKTRLLSDLYDDCLLALDAELGRFLDEMRASGRLANTWVVLTADHGEYFGEHGLFGHGGRLHNEVTHVPLMLIPPMGSTDADDPSLALRGRRIATPVSLCDLPATLADLLVPGSSHPFRGRSLSRFWNDAPPPADPILMQMEEQPLEGEDVPPELVVKTDAVLDEGHVLIRSNAKPIELFRLDDRLQQNDLATDPAEADRLRRMRETLAKLLGRDGASGRD